MSFTTLATGTAAIGTAVTKGMIIHDQATNLYSTYSGSAWMPLTGATPRLILTKSGVQSLTTGVVADVTNHTTTLNQGGFTVNTTTGAVTLPYTGYYNITIQHTYATGTAGIRMAVLMLNAAVHTRTQVPAPPTNLNTSALLSLNGYKFTAGDILTQQAMQSSGGALNLEATSLMTISFVGA